MFNKYENKIKSLKAIIYSALLPRLKGKTCVYLDLPYHENIGDALIWYGTEQFLKANKIPCLLRQCKDTFCFPKLDKDIVILLQGGGNYGDVWPIHHQFRNKVVRHYPDNEIIILPQTIFFEKEENIISDAKDFGNHKKLTIVARDQVSFDILKRYYSVNKILMLPDMAFCIDFNLLEKYAKKTSKPALFFKRTDKEAKDLYSFEKLVPSTAEQHEWPTMEPHKKTIYEWGLSFVYKFNVKKNWYWNNIMLPNYVIQGIRFVSQYKDIYTTRLHGAILSVLLGKEITFFDNSYGKNRNFYETWLKDTDIIFKECKI